MVDRARAWRHSAHAAICDVLAPWAHGTIARATRYPDYFDYNVVRVEDDPAMTVDALVAFADEVLAGLGHRRIDFDFDFASAGEPLRADFEADGWQALRLLWMRHDRRPARRAGIAIERVGHDAVDDLRAAWYREEFPGQDAGDYYAQAREVAQCRGARVVAVRDRADADFETAGCRDS